MEQKLADLENGKYGIAFGSGLGSITAICQLLEAGDHVVCGDDLYGGTYRLMAQMVTKNGIEVTFADLTNLSEYEKALKKNTKVCILLPAQFTYADTMIHVCDIYDGVYDTTEASYQHF